MYTNHADVPQILILEIFFNFFSEFFEIFEGFKYELILQTPAHLFHHVKVQFDA